MNPLNIVLWVALPYVCGAIFVIGHVWRYRSDKFGWTTRSSQVYESRLLRWGSPMFHLGILMVIAGHVVGLLIPREWLYAIGIDEHLYHIGATVLGTAAAVLTLAGLAILIYRRLTVGPVLLATSVMDKVMYLFLGATLLFGTLATVVHQVFGGGFSYRETVSPWFRHLLTFSPDPTLMLEVPLLFQLHVVTALLLFALWPFTRLVHVFSAPLGYLVRPYIVYRSRDAMQERSRPARRGWDPVTPPDAGRLRQR
ncbi:respiratory nitrate reductase subunit gamma [Leucobacter tardus]|uniref:Nitrate reductase-like protein NarX n=1 Tax=Leucobacter tardus TaxID=501483 RepID=A0A939TUT9_9MICO|nr:respiratory nitrate reductase subunit gamma [Leucobacter tardus]MBO2990090.1 respiratory nitrate reductase subunit gamma [Leucobacter tardus]